jgi:hypothetical protein
VAVALVAAVVVKAAAVTVAAAARAGSAAPTVQAHVAVAAVVVVKAAAVAAATEALNAFFNKRFKEKPRSAGFFFVCTQHGRTPLEASPAASGSQ